MIGALAAGYLAYGEAFVRAVSHEDLRDLMHNRHVGMPEAELKQVDIYAADLLRIPPTDRKGLWLRLATEKLGRFGVVLVPSRDRFMVAVGCLGQFVGFLSVRSKSELLPNSGEYNWGHVFGAASDGQLQRGSWSETFDQLQQYIRQFKARRLAGGE